MDAVKFRTEQMYTVYSKLNLTWKKFSFRLLIGLLCSHCLLGSNDMLVLLLWLSFSSAPSPSSPGLSFPSPPDYPFSSASSPSSGKPCISFKYYEGMGQTHKALHMYVWSCRKKTDLTSWNKQLLHTSIILLTCKTIWWGKSRHHYMESYITHMDKNMIKVNFLPEWRCFHLHYHLNYWLDEIKHSISQNPRRILTLKWERKTTILMQFIRMG